MSLRDGDRGFFIKRTGAYLDVPGSYIFVPFYGDAPKEASSEYRVHHAVYTRTRYRAIVHAHPPFAVAASLVMDSVIPIDSKAIMFCPRIPVVTGDPGTQALADNVAGALLQAKLVIARGHGTFAAGDTLDEAFQLTSLAEHACRVIALQKILSKKK
jgi:L-fuculose-phosphate aldolase